jgi:hypothetical protein
MKRAVITAIVLSLALVAPAFAIESNAPPNAPPKTPAATFDQRKAQMLKYIDERSTRLQQEKACVQATKNDDDLRSCMGKFGPPHGPSGPVGAGRPGITPPPGGSPPPGGAPPPQGQ